MNTLWLSNVEIVAESERADFSREMDKVRLAREALGTRPHQPGWLERRLLTLSAWMVDTGERLSRRYHNADPMPRWYPSFKIAK